MVDFIQTIILKSFLKLDFEVLEQLPNDGDIFYSESPKDELIRELDVLFGEIKAKGYNALKYETSTCKYCYKNADTYLFSSIDNSYSIRYVISKESSKNYIVQECLNSKTSSNEELAPF